MKIAVKLVILGTTYFLFLLNFTGYCFESKLTNLVRKANIIELGCEGQPINLMCGSEEGIKVKSVFWGRSDTTTCPSANPKKTTKQLCKEGDPNYPLKKVKTLCDSEPRCILHASETYFEAPLCPKVSKYLRVVYDCRLMSGMNA